MPVSLITCDEVFKSLKQGWPINVSREPHEKLEQCWKVEPTIS